MYLKSNFFIFFKKITQIKNKKIEVNKQINRYLDKKPTAANNPSKKQSVILISFEEKIFHEKYVTKDQKGS